MGDRPSSGSDEGEAENGETGDKPGRNRQKSKPYIIDKTTNPANKTQSSKPSHDKNSPNHIARNVNISCELGPDTSISRARSESNSSSGSSSVSLIDPPDGGWGWAVVAASFFIHMIADGCAFSFGVFYIEFLEVFGESKGKTAAVGSLFLAVPLITGPIAGALTNHFGCRKTCMAGGFLAGCGFVISSFMDTIETLCVTFGLVAGFGLSMVYVPAIVVVAFYFETKRAFATGIAVAGTGIGTFLFAPLTEYLIKEYTWRGATLIIGGMMFNIIVAGTFFRPLTSPKIERRKRKLIANSTRFSSRLTSRYTSMEHICNGTEGALSGRRMPHVERLMYEPVTTSLLHFPTFMKQEIEPLYRNSMEELTKAGQDGKTLQEVLVQHGLLDKFYYYQSTEDIHTGNGISLDNNSATQKSEPLQYTVSCIEPSAQTHSKIDSDKPGVSAGGETHVLATADNLDGLGRKRKISKNTRSEFDQLQPLYRKDIFYRGNLVRMRMAPVAKSASCPNIALHYEDESSVSDFFFNRQFAMCNFLKLSREIRSAFMDMLNVSIFRSPVFLYFTFSSFLLYLAYDVPYVFTPDMAKQMPYVSTTMASFTVSLIGITSTFGQILLGWIGDFPNVNAIHLYNAITSIAGIITFLVPKMHTYATLCVYSACYGFFISANYALTTIILVQLLGMNKLTNAYGIVMLAEGIANLLGPPAAGFIGDATGDYDLTFIIAGTLIFISGFMLTLIPCLAKYDQSSDYHGVSQVDEHDGPHVTSSHHIVRDVIKETSLLERTNCESSMDPVAGDYGRKSPTHCDALCANGHELTKKPTKCAVKFN